MSEETQLQEVKEVSIDTLPMREFKAARAEGKERVEQKVESVVEEKKAEESGEENKEEDKPKGKGGFQSRIDRLVKQLAMKEEELEKVRGSAKVEEKAPVVTAEGEPKREDFQNEPAYIKALTRWELKQAIKEQAEADAKANHETREKEIVTAYNERAAEAKSRYDDWDETVNQSIDIPASVGRQCLLLPNGPDLAYFLGKNAEVRAELLAMDPIEAAGEARIIADKLAAESHKEEPEEKEEIIEEKPKKLESKAPPPIKPLGTGTAKSTIPLDKMNIRDYKKARSAGRIQ